MGTIARPVFHGPLSRMIPFMAPPNRLRSPSSAGQVSPVPRGIRGCLLLVLGLLLSSETPPRHVPRVRWMDIFPARTLERAPLQEWAAMVNDGTRLGTVPDPLGPTQVVNFVETLLRTAALPEPLRIREHRWLTQRLQAHLDVAVRDLERARNHQERTTRALTFQQVHALAYHLGLPLRHEPPPLAPVAVDEPLPALDTLFEQALYRLLLAHGQARFLELKTWSMADVAHAPEATASQYGKVLEELPPASQPVAEVVDLAGAQKALHKARTQGDRARIGALEHAVLDRLQHVISYFPSPSNSEEEGDCDLPPLWRERRWSCVGASLILSTFLDLLAIPHEVFLPEGHIALLVRLADGSEWYVDAMKRRDPVRIDGMPRAREGNCERIHGVAASRLAEVGQRVNAPDAFIACLYSNRAARLSDPVLKRRAYQTALRWERDHIPALTGLGLLLAKEDRDAEAKTLFRRAQALNPTDQHVAGLIRWCDLRTRPVGRIP